MMFVLKRRRVCPHVLCGEWGEVENRPVLAIGMALGVVQVRGWLQWGCGEVGGPRARSSRIEHS